LAYAIPQHAVNEITGVLFTITTSSAVGTRQPYLALRSSLGTTATARNLITPFPTQKNSSTESYQAWVGSPEITVTDPPPATTIANFAGLPNHLRMKYGDYVTIQMIDQDVNDSFSNLWVWGNEWLVP
jgi:hypothetical protein